MITRFFLFLMQSSPLKNKNLTTVFDTAMILFLPSLFFLQILSDTHLHFPSNSWTLFSPIIIASVYIFVSTIPLIDKEVTVLIDYNVVSWRVYIFLSS